MNDLVVKVKNYFSTNFGKFSLLVMGLSFLLTLIFSTLLRNRIDVSIIRAFISTIITGIILYSLAIVLKRFLSDAVGSSGVFDSNTSNNITDKKEENNELDILKDNTDFNELRDNIQMPAVEKTDFNELRDNIQMPAVEKTENDESNDMQIQNDNNNEEKSILDSLNTQPEINNIDDIKPDINDINKHIDKNVKVDYHTGGIGDIISSVGMGDSQIMSDISELFPKKENTDAVNLEREVKDDPEKVAKAVRTMLAKEDKKDKKEKESK